MWVFSTEGFTSAVEYMPPRTTVVKKAVYKTVKEAVKKYDEALKRDVIVEPAETELVTPEVREPYSDPYEDKLVDYVRGTYDSVDPVTKEKIPGVPCSHLLIRARVEADLEPLKKYDPNAVFFEDKYADYQFRCIILRTAFAQYNYDLTMGIDYNSHVKETINKRAPQVQGGRYSALSGIWSLCNKWQPVRPYSGGITKYDTDWGTTDYGSSYSQGYSGSYTKYSKPSNNGGYVSSFGAVEPNETYVPKAASERNVLAGLTGKASGGSDSMLDDVLSTLPDIDVDTPNDDDAWWETDLKNGEVTRKTMEAQISDLFRAVGESSNYDVQDVVDYIEELYGTCDIDVIETGELWDVIDTKRLAGAEDSPLVKVLGV